MLEMFWMHTVTVEAYTGPGSQGPLYAAPVDVKGLIDDSLHLVRKAQNQEVISETVFYTDVDNEPLFPVNSRVTLGGRVAHVTSVNGYSSPTLPLPAHLEVHLT